MPSRRSFLRATTQKPAPAALLGPWAPGESAGASAAVRAGRRGGTTGVPARDLRGVLTAVFVAALFALATAAPWHAPGVTQDEGMMLEYPMLVDHGELPFRDFQSSYGPDTYLTLAGVYAVTGPSLGAERAVGAVYRGVLILAVLALVWACGPVVALAAGS